MSDFSLRELGADDLDGARQLFDLWRRNDNVSAPPATGETLTDLLGRGDFHVFAAFVKDEIVGGLTAYELEMVTANATELFVYDVSVEAAYHRRGVGRALIEAARELCVARGLSALYVPALADDARAVAFYAACGLGREDVAWFTQEFGESAG